MFQPREKQAEVLEYVGGDGVSAALGSGKTQTLSALAAKLVRESGLIDQEADRHPGEPGGGELRGRVAGLASAGGRCWRVIGRSCTGWRTTSPASDRGWWGCPMT
jgi:hypothetical protein